MKKLFFIVVLALAGCGEPTAEQQAAWRAAEIKQEKLRHSFPGKRLKSIRENFSQVIFEFEDGTSIEAWSNKAVRLEYHQAK